MIIRLIVIAVVPLVSISVNWYCLSVMVLCSVATKDLSDTAVITVDLNKDS